MKCHFYESAFNPAKMDAAFLHACVCVRACVHVYVCVCVCVRARASKSLLTCIQKSSSMLTAETAYRWNIRLYES